MGPGEPAPCECCRVGSFYAFRKVDGVKFRLCHDCWLDAEEHKPAGETMLRLVWGQRAGR